MSRSKHRRNARRPSFVREPNFWLRQFSAKWKAVVKRLVRAGREDEIPPEKKMTKGWYW